MVTITVRPGFTFRHPVRGESVVTSVRRGVVRFRADGIVYRTTQAALTALLPYWNN